MANFNDIDMPPLYDTLTKENKEHLSNIWIGWLSTFYQTLISYITSGGIFLPQLTTEERDNLESPQFGQMIYNTTLGTAQYYKPGSPDSWVSF